MDDLNYISYIKLFDAPKEIEEMFINWGEHLRDSFDHEPKVSQEAFSFFLPKLKSIDHAGVAKRIGFTDYNYFHMPNIADGEGNYDSKIFSFHTNGHIEKLFDYVCNTIFDLSNDVKVGMHYYVTGGVDLFVVGAGAFNGKTMSRHHHRWDLKGIERDVGVFYPHATDEHIIERFGDMSPAACEEIRLRDEVPFLDKFCDVRKKFFMNTLGTA